MNKLMKCAAMAMVCAWVATGTAQAVPMSITYQGVLSEVVEGVVVPMSAPNALLEVRLYTEASGGTAVWGHEVPVTLDDGAFNMEISDSIGSELIPASLQSVVQSATGSLYIGLTVKGGEEITPRQRMLSTAYAVAAKSAEESANNFSVNGNLGVAGSTAMNGATTVSGLFTTSGGFWMNGGASVQNSALRLYETAPLEVRSSATMKSNVTMSATSDLQVNGKFMRKHLLNRNANLGFSELPFNVWKTAKQDMILCLTGGNSNTVNEVIAVFFDDGAGEYVAAQSYLLPSVGQASLTVPIPKGQKFKMTMSHSTKVYALVGYVTTFCEVVGWGNMW